MDDDRPLGTPAGYEERPARCLPAHRRIQETLCSSVHARTHVLLVRNMELLDQLEHPRRRGSKVARPHLPSHLQLTASQGGTQPRQLHGSTSRSQRCGLPPCIFKEFVFTPLTGLAASMTLAKIGAPADSCLSDKGPNQNTQLYSIACACFGGGLSQFTSILKFVGFQ